MSPKIKKIQLERKKERKKENKEKKRKKIKPFTCAKKKEAKLKEIL